MKKTTALALVIGLGLSFTRQAHAWISYVDFNDSMFPPDPPWTQFSNEGSMAFVDLGGGNMALRLDSPDHTVDDPNPPPGTYYNEYYVTNLPPEPTALEFYEPVAATRFRLHSFTATGKENILAPSTPVAAPTITLVDGHYWLWSFLSDEANQPILDLGPAVADQWHEVYIMLTIEGIDDTTGVPNAGGAKVWWDGSFVFDGPVDGGANVSVGGYIEFGSGCYWQVDAGTAVDFDWVGFGDVNDFPAPPAAAADFDEDGDVDGSDLTEWTGSFGLPSGAMHSDGDSDADGDVDGADFLVWQQQLGGGAGAAAVPEPTALFAVASASYWLAAACRRSTKRRAML